MSTKQFIIRSFLIACLLFFSSFLLLYLMNWFVKELPNDMDSVLIEYCEDKQSLLLSQISKSNNFIPLSGHQFNCYTESSYWIRFKLKMASETKFTSMIIQNISYKNCAIYIPTSNNQYSELISKRNKEVEFIYSYYKFPDNIDLNQYVYIKLNAPSNNIINMNINLYSENQLVHYYQRSLFVNSLIIGCVISIGVYNLLIFLNNRERSYLHFSLFIFINTFIFIILLFNWLQFFNLNTLLQKFFYLSMYASLLLFIFNLYKLNYPKTKAIFYALIALKGFSYFLFSLFHNLILYNLFSLIIYLVPCSFLIYTYIKGNHISKYFIIGTTISLNVVTYLILKQSGLFLLDSSISFFPRIILVATLLFFSHALSFNYKVQLAEKEIALKLKISAEELSAIKKLEFLQSQIKPHFLYNSINIIIALCKIDINKARRLTNNLSSYLSLSFDFIECSHLISLSKELEYVQFYVNIQKERFLNKFYVIYEFDENITTNNLFLPPFTLQPLVENAIRHGIKMTNKCEKIIISIKKDELGYHLSVSDNGAGISQDVLTKLNCQKGEKAGIGIGIKNINERLNELYGTCLIFESSPNWGTKVSFSIPLHLSNNEEKI